MIASESAVALPPLPASRRLTVLLTACGFLAGLGTVWLIKPQPVQPLPGTLTARTLEIRSPRIASLREIVAAEGQAVAPGDVLARLDDPVLEALIVARRNELRTLRDELAHLQLKHQSHIEWEERRLGEDAREYRAERNKLMYKQLTAQTAPAGNPESSGLHFRNISSPAPLEQVSATAGSTWLLKQIQYLETRRASLRVAGDVRQRLSTLEEKIVQLDRIVAELEQQQAALELTTTGYGTVMPYRRNVGELLSTGEPVVQVVDEAIRWVTLQIPSSRQPRFPAESRVELEFPDGSREPGVVQAPADASAEVLHLRIVPAGGSWPKCPVGSVVQVYPAASR